MNAESIQRGLRYRHSKDLYIEECKNGPTQSIGARPIRLDGWAFLRTWSPVTSVGYEVKVSRGDFLGDHKWRDYLRLCHQFYFVAPKGLIQLAELPEGVGLMEAIGGQNGNMPRIVTRRKAQYHEPEPVAYLSLVHYVLMARVREGGTWVRGYDGRQEDEQTRRERVTQEWTEWLEARGRLGDRVRGRIAEEVRRSQDEADKARKLVAGYERVRDTLRALGFDPDKPVSEWGLEKRISAALDIADRPLIESLMTTRNKLDTAIGQLEELQARAAFGQPPSVGAVDPVGERVTG